MHGLRRPIVWRWALVLTAGVVAALAWAVLIAAAQRMPDPGSPRELGLAAQLERGGDIYAFYCTTCHGVSGQGFAEARAAFPADHYDCSRCHMPLNPPAMTPAEIELAQSVFSLGDPPPLADAAALSHYGSAAGLFAYVRATMPRWYPGMLRDEDVLDVTVYVLDLAGVTLHEELTLETLAALDLTTATRD